MRKQRWNLNVQPWLFTLTIGSALLSSPVGMAQDVSGEGATATETTQPALTPRERVKERRGVVRERRQERQENRQERRQERRANIRENRSDLTSAQRQNLGNRYRRWRSLNPKQKRRVWNSLNPKEKRAFRRLHAAKQNPQRRIDKDNNPPGPRGGRGTNWENPPGPRGGPGASPDRRRWGASTSSGVSGGDRRSHRAAPRPHRARRR